MYELNERGVVDVLIVYVQTTLASIFLLFCLITYFFIFAKHATNKRQFSSQTLTVLQVFKRSRFYVSVLLVTSFLLLVVLPMVVYSFSRF